MYDESRLGDMVSELSQQMAVVANKIENLTSVVIANNKKSEVQSVKIDALEKSRTQIFTVLAVFLAFSGTLASVGFWSLEARIDQQIDDALNRADIVYLMCNRYRDTPSSSRPVICQ